MNDLIGWVQIILLYTWLFGAMYVFYMWTRLTNKILTSMENFTNTFTLLMNNTTTSLENITTLLSESIYGIQEFNPLLQEENDEEIYEKCKIE